MARKKPIPAGDQSEEASEDWLLTYADSITLLMCFFVLTTGISHVDLKTVEKVSGALAEGFGKRAHVRPIASLEAQINVVLSDLQISSDAVVGTDLNDNLVIELPSDLLFRSGSSSFKPESVSYLDEIILSLQDAKFSRYEVVVEAYSAQGAASGKFDGLWDLTSSRSAQLARYFIYRSEFDPARITATSFGDSRPRATLLPIDTRQGTEDVKRSIDTDNRVVIRMEPMSGRTGQPNTVFAK